MDYKEEDYLMLSGIQHFAFCRRQWALIHIEQQWQENERTVEGELLHERAHDTWATEKRSDVIISRGLPVQSRMMGISGSCDIVEFHRAEEGVPLYGHRGLFRVYPIEYKRGKPKDIPIDMLQLTAQAMCLEEMLCCEIPDGALFYGETRRRVRVPFPPELREEVRTDAAQMHDLYRRGRTPQVKPTKSCSACSLRELCLPRLSRTGSVQAYLRANMEDAP